MRCALAASTQLCEAAQQRLGRSPYIEVRRTLAANPTLSLGLQLQLASDLSESVRQALARPGLAPQVNERLLRAAQPEDRAALTRHLEGR